MIINIKFEEKMLNIVQVFTGQAGPVNKKLTGLRQYLLATGQQASAKLYTAVGSDVAFAFTSI